ncbi:MAG TPA: GTPase ObgE [Candidatus Eremiobacteraceae bacterium]|nr:GTPase ObgE [Candidatus Eremiobacteraceae bacterium]
MFVDQAHIVVRGGSGGNGVVAFRREKFIPRGGPNGGDGGRGGSIYLVTDAQRTTLTDFRHKRRFRAEDGEAGGSSNCHGKDGADIDIAVPAGTLVYAGGELIADLSEPGARVCVASGGRGGLGNQHFATSTRQTPRFAQSGEPGEERSLDLQLKLLADAGIVGAPNAGKSTLLSVLTSAKPKIADYPFTTIEPQLGVVQLDVDASFVLVEVPGLVEGASRGVGLGDTFLRHVERCQVLIQLVDGALPPAQAVAQLATIDRELAAWSAALADKKRIIAVSKQDLPEAAATLQALREGIDETILGISAVTRQGLRELVAATYAAIVAARQEAASGERTVLHPKAAAAASIMVSKERGAFRVSGEKIERLASMTDFENPDGRAYFDRVLARSGARRKLERLGLRAGDTIRVGDREFINA